MWVTSSLKNKPTIIYILINPSCYESFVYKMLEYNEVSMEFLPTARNMSERGDNLRATQNPN